MAARSSFSHCRKAVDASEQQDVTPARGTPDLERKAKVGAAVRLGLPEEGSLLLPRPEAHDPVLHVLVTKRR